MITFSSRRFHITPKPMFLYQHRSPCIQPPMSRPVTGNRSDGLKIGKASVGIHKMMCSSFFATIFAVFNLEVQPPILKIGWKLRSTFFPLKILRAYHLKETTIFMMMLTLHGLYILMSCPFGVLMLITCGSKPGATAPDAFRHLRPNPGFLSKSPHPHEDNSMERPV